MYQAKTNWPMRAAALPVLSTLMGVVLLCVFYSTVSASTRVYFTDPPAINPEARDAVIGFIDQAETTLDVAIYSFSYDRTGSTLTQIAGALNAARQRGVQLRIVTDIEQVNSQSSVQYIILDTLDGNRNNILDPAVVRAGNSNGIMHNKFIVADGERVLTGSTNWTSSGFFGQENNVLLLEGSAIANAYSIEFQAMWNGSFGKKNSPIPTRFYQTTDGVDIELLFGADDDFTGRLISAIDGASEKLFFSINVFSSGAKADLIGAAMQRAANRGVDVRGVFDSASDQWHNLYGYPGIHITDYFGGVLHSKFMIIDPLMDAGYTLTGSNNWSNNADDRNDENLVGLFHRPLTNAYYDNFRRMYVERSSFPGGNTPLFTFGDLTGDGQVTLADLEEARKIARGEKQPTSLQLITGDVMPNPGVNGHTFGDGRIDYKEVLYLAAELGVPAGIHTVSDLLALPDGTEVFTDAVVVTASFGNLLYVQQQDRTSGVRVQGVTAPLGSRVSVTGVMASLATTGERFISANSITILEALGALPDALNMQTENVGGEALNSLTPGITGGVSLYNIGLRVAVTGRVTGLSTLSFFVDDGAGLREHTGRTGIKVNSGAFTRPPVGSIVRVSGVSSMESVLGKRLRLLRPARSEDIQILHQP